MDGEAANVAGGKLQRSNVVAVAVSPGITRTDTIAPLLAANREDPLRFTFTGAIMSVLLFSVVGKVLKLGSDTSFSNRCCGS